MPPEFLYSLLLSLLTMTVFYVFLLLYRLRIEERADMLAERLAER